MHDVLLVDRLKNVRADGSVKIGFHVLNHKIDVFVVIGFQHVGQENNMSVATEFLEEHDLTEGSVRIIGILEHIADLLQGYNLAGLLISGLPNNTISTLSELGANIIFATKQKISG